MVGFARGLPGVRRGSQTVVFAHLSRSITIGTDAEGNSTNRIAAPAEYDDAGNQTKSVFSGVSTDFTWYPTGEMQTMTRGETSDRDFRYTAAGERTVVRYQPATGKEILTFTLRDPENRPLRTYRKANGTWLWEKDYVYRGGQLLATVTPVLGVHHAHLDHLGSARFMTDEVKAEASFHAFFPFGEEAPDRPDAVGSGLVVQWDSERLKFTGHERDAQATLEAPADDLDYMHARYYGVMVGRFQSPDTASGVSSLPLSWNRYVYVRDNPVRFHDPDGLRDPLCEAMSRAEMAKHIDPQVIRDWDRRNFTFGMAAVATLAVIRLPALAGVGFIARSALPTLQSMRVAGIVGGLSAAGTTARHGGSSTTSSSRTRSASWLAPRQVPPRQSPQSRVGWRVVWAMQPASL